jgi:hypothetical protein
MVDRRWLGVGMRSPDSRLNDLPMTPADPNRGDAQGDPDAAYDFDQYLRGRC